MTVSEIRNQLSDDDILETKPDIMVKLLATIGEDNNPNLVLIVSLEAKDPTTLMFAEFIYGKTKKNVERNPKCAAGFMSLGFDWILVKGDFTNYIYEGDDYEYYNQKSLFKNNAYLAVTRVGFINIKQVFPKRKIKTKRPLLRLLKGYIKEQTPYADNLPLIVRKIFRAPSNLKYIAYIDQDGYPMIVPAMHLLPTETNKLIFIPADYKHDFSSLQKGQFVAAFAMNIEDLLMYQIKGTYHGVQDYQENEVGVIDIEEVYCCMPPKAGDRIL